MIGKIAQTCCFFREFFFESNFEISESLGQARVAVLLLLVLRITSTSKFIFKLTTQEMPAYTNFFNDFGSTKSFPKRHLRLCWWEIFRDFPSFSQFLKCAASKRLRIRDSKRSRWSDSDCGWLNYLILACVPEGFVERTKKCRVWKMLWKCFSMRSRSTWYVQNPLTSREDSYDSSGRLSTPLIKISSDREKLWKEMF